jgi:hypothetical protein
MSYMARIAFAASISIVAAGLVSPAFAQSSDRTGSQLPHYYGTNGALVWGSWAPESPQASAANPQAEMRDRGLHALAMTPRAGRAKSPRAYQR